MCVPCSHTLCLFNVLLSGAKNRGGSVRLTIKYLPAFQHLRLVPAEMGQSADAKGEKQLEHRPLHASPSAPRYFPQRHEQVAPIIKGSEGCSDEPPLPLPEAMSWAAAGSNGAIATAFAFLAAEAEIMATWFVSRSLKTHMETWVSNWDGAAIAPRKAWLAAEVSPPPSLSFFSLALP